MSTDGVTAVQQEETLTFGSEEERISAMEALGDSQDALEKLDRIRSAAIVPAAADGADAAAGVEQPETPPQAAAADVQPVETPATVTASGPITLTPEELRAAGFTYTNRDDLLKGLKEKEAHIERQKAYINEHLRSGDNAAQRISELESELAKARSAAQQPTVTPQQSPQFAGAQAQPGSVAAAQNTLAGIQAELAELEKAEVDPYDQDSVVAYQRQQTKLLGMQAQAMANLVTAQAATQSGLERQHAAEFAERQQREAERQRREQEARETQARIAAYAEIDAAGSDPELAEFRLSKPAAEVEKELSQWRMDIASVYYGRPPKTQEEFNQAIRQYELKNSDILNKCKLAGIPTEPSRDFMTLSLLYDAMDYRDGIRPGPLDANGEPPRELRYDPVTGRNVPVILPDLKTAIKLKRLNDGHYAKQIDNAYQRGAQSLAQAMTKRDPSIPELNSPSTMGVGGNSSADAAVEYLAGADTEAAMLQYQQGNTSMVDEINRARAILGMKPMDFSR